MKIVFCWDDGAKEDLILFKLHEKYKIPGMFFVPTHNREKRDVLSKEEISNASNSPFIFFGGHTENHIYLKEIPNKTKIKEELSLNKCYLENATNSKIEHFCFPGGSYTRNIFRETKLIFKTARTADTCSFKGNKNGLIRPSFHFYDRGVKSLIANSAKHGSFKEMIFFIKERKKDYFDLIKETIQLESKNKNKIIIIWGHSWEIEEKNLWGKLEDLFDFVSANYCECIIRYEDL